MRSVCSSLTIARHFCVYKLHSLFFHPDGSFPFVIQDLKIISKGLPNELLQILIIRILILFGPCDLFGFKF